MSKPLSTTQAASRLNVTEQEIRRLLKAGILTGTCEPFGPGVRWSIDAASVAKRLKAKERGEVKPGRPSTHPTTKG